VDAGPGSGGTWAGPLSAPGTLYRRVRLVAIWRRPKLTPAATRPMTTWWPRSQPGCWSCPAGRWCWPIDVTAGAWVYRLGRRRAGDFIAFLEQMLQAFPRAPVIVAICENDSIHHARKVTACLSEHPRLELLPGARYSPHDDPVERIWGGLKNYVANARFTESQAIASQRLGHHFPPASSSPDDRAAGAVRRVEDA
jgi:transposase